jgi:hypothetical protein
MVHFAGRVAGHYASLNLKSGRSKDDGNNEHTTTGEVLRLSREHHTGKMSRYAALNATEKTMEFRIFKSTNDLEEYKRNLLFVDSIIQYARTHSMPKNGAPSLTRYRGFLESNNIYAPVRGHFDAWKQKPALIVANHGF